MTNLYGRFGPKCQNDGPSRCHGWIAAARERLRAVPRGLGDVWEPFSGKGSRNQRAAVFSTVESSRKATSTPFRPARGQKSLFGDPPDIYIYINIYDSRMISKSQNIKEIPNNRLLRHVFFLQRSLLWTVPEALLERHAARRGRPRRPRGRTAWSSARCSWSRRPGQEGLVGAQL